MSEVPLYGGGGTLALNLRTVPEIHSTTPEGSSSISASTTVFRIRVESGPLRAVHLSRHKWPGGHLLSSQGFGVEPAPLSSEYGTYKTVKALAFR